MLTKIKTAAVAAAMLAGTAIPAAAQDSCGVVVFFNNGQATLDAAAQAALNDFLSRNAGEPLTVTGYTDAVGSAASNQALSERRAASVAGTLQGANTIRPTAASRSPTPAASAPRSCARQVATRRWGRAWWSAVWASSRWVLPRLWTTDRAAPAPAPIDRIGTSRGSIAIPFLEEALSGASFLLPAGASAAGLRHTQPES